MPDRSDILRYYDARAHEYEKVYEKPERQGDLLRLHDIVPTYLAGRRVLDVACGTGYWTRRVARRAAAVTGCDRSPEVLSLARQLQPAGDAVRLLAGDAFSLGDVPGEFDAAFLGFWWSHLLREDVPRFLAGLHGRLTPGGRVLAVDNRYVHGSNWPVTRTDSAGNTYQRRLLDDGAEYEVLKNFPPPDELRSAIAAAGGRDPIVHELSYYWYATYEVATVA
jgi:SAM-dependent methyltransferase